MWQSKLFWKLFLVYGGLIIILLVGFFVGIGIWQRSQVSESVQERLHAAAAVLRSDVRDDLLLLSASQSDEQRIALTSRLQQSIVKLGKETQLRLTVVMERTIDVHVRALRRKLGEHADVIETVRGVGYRFRDPQTAAQSADYF